MESINTKMKDWDFDNKGYLKFKSFSRNNDSSRNEISLSSNGNYISHPIPESSNPPLASTNVTSSASTYQENPTEYHIEKFVNGTLSDSNILKSVRTYAKKKESISSVFCDKLYSDTEKSVKTSKDDNKYLSKNKYLKTYTDKSNSSRPSSGVFENRNSCGDFRNNFNNSSTNGFSGDLKNGLCADDAIFSLYDSPNERESLSLNESDLTSTISDEVTINGYLRTRKNLKNHLVEQKKLDDDSEDDTYFRKAKTTRETQISASAFLPNGSRKKPRIRKFSKVKPHVSSANDSDILKSPKASIEKMHKNSSSLSIDIIPPSNCKKKLSMLDVVQMLSVKRQKQVSETSPEVTKKDSFETFSPSEVKVNSRKKDSFETFSPSEVKVNSRKKDSFETLSPSEVKVNSTKKESVAKLSRSQNNSYLSKCNSLYYIASKDSNLKKDKVTNRTKNLRIGKATNLCQGKAKSESLSSKHGLLINEKPCNAIRNKLQSADNLGLLDDKINVDGGLENFINEPCKVSGYFKHHPPKSIPLSRTVGKKRSISCDRGLNIVKRPHLSLTSDATAVDAANGYSLAKSNGSILRSPTQNSFMNGDPLKSYTASVQNIPIQESLTRVQKADNPHICSKTKLLHVPIIVCDCGNSNPTDDGNTFMPSLTAEVNNFALTVVNIVKQNPENFQSLSYNHYKTFCESVQRVFHQTSVENSCDIFDLHSSVTTNPLSKAVPFKGDSELDGNQCQAFINSAFNFSNECVYKMINSFVRNLDVCELQFTVKHFCSSPQVVRFMSEFFSGCDKFSPTSVSEEKFQFVFSENDPLCSVVKDYTKLFVHKVWPVGSKTIASQSLMEFAYKNMSAAEISIMSYFFYRTELLTLKDFVSRFTYVAVLSIYKFHGRIK